MIKNLVFVPCSVHGRKKGVLYGVVRDYNLVNEKAYSSCYFILKVEPSLLSRIDSERDGVLQKLGDFEEHGESVFLSLFRPGLKSNEIQIWLTDDSFQVVPQAPVGSNQDDSSSVVIVIYDDTVFKDSELILEVNGAIESKDHFQVLARLLHETSQGKTNKFLNFLSLFWAMIFCVSKLCLHIVSFARPVFQYSALGSHLHEFLTSLTWAFESLKCQKKVSLKVGNYLAATAVDVCAGILLLHFMDYLGITALLSDYILRVAKDVVHNMHHLLEWLSGSPAGLKLNGPYNLIMGRFFMYHIKLWWIFLSVTQHVLDLLFSIFLLLGRLGVTFQAAILIDLLFLVSFHIYCIYVYAARIYFLQLSGLQALWRLFLGRKHNPLRDRVDSCQYSPDQLFVGTLAFTVLLFLLPTTFMYYVVFTTIRLILLSLSGFLIQACYLIHALPILSTIHWFFRSNTVCKSVYVTSKTGTKDKSVVLFVTPVVSSWFHTVKCCLPDTLSQPPRVDFGELIHKLMIGELIYPVIVPKDFYDNKMT